LVGSAGLVGLDQGVPGEFEEAENSEGLQHIRQIDPMVLCWYYKDAVLLLCWCYVGGMKVLC
jgi:hypothetical protein